MINNNQNKKPLRIAFIHPDLGIGGAERLVVDTAIGLQKLGHHVQIFTSSHQPDRCFSETIDGTLKVTVLGHSIFPRSISNRFITLLAILRQIHLSLHLIISYQLKTFTHQDQEKFDVFFIDQLSASIPLIRLGTHTRVLFYCHFPDLLLNPPPSQNQISIYTSIKSLYRIPLDWIEEFTTAQADRILVNSKFTASVFKRTFKKIKHSPQCVYPGVDLELYQTTDDDEHSQLTRLKFEDDRPIILSINRFETKKDIGLLLKAYIKLMETYDQSDDRAQQIPRLVLAGGYDQRLVDNRLTIQSLYDLIETQPKPLTHQTILNTDQDQSLRRSTDILFMPNITQTHKLNLLRSRSTRVLAYTASNEHLGIGPLEGMASGLPVLATNSGGPTETIKDGQTGFLIEPDPLKWSNTLQTILNFDDHQRHNFKISGQERISKKFSIEVMSKRFEENIYQVLESKISFFNLSLIRSSFLIVLLSSSFLSLVFYSTIGSLIFFIVVSIFIFYW